MQSSLAGINDDDDDDESIKLVFIHPYSKNSHECANKNMLWQTVQFLVHAGKRMADDSREEVPAVSSTRTVLRRQSCKDRSKLCVSLEWQGHHVQLERSCFRQWKQQPVSRRMWSANVSSWSIVMPRQVTTGRRSTTEPLATKTELSTLASWYFVPRHVNCVFSAFSLSLLEDIQSPISSIHAIRRANVASQLMAGVCRHSWVSSAYK